MIIKTASLIFNDIKLPARWAHKLRGYIADLYPEYLALHQHDGGKFIYKYPLIQYKIINKIPVIIGIEAGAKILEKIFLQIDKLELGEKNIKIFDKSINKEEVEWGESPIPIKYEFLTPWIALNQLNFKEYIKSEIPIRKKMLEKVIIGNILSASKTIGYTVTETLQSFVCLETVDVNYKNKKMLGFKGEFNINFKIPAFWGLGKSVSRGFGTVGLFERKDEAFWN